jgi:hypothetical protein
MAQQRNVHESLYQRSQLDIFFAERNAKDKLLHSMPRLNIGECDPRAKAKGVYVLTLFNNAENAPKMCTPVIGFG